VRAVLLDGLGTLVALEPPWPYLVKQLRERDIEISSAQAERAFRAEMTYYRAHHLEGRDPVALKELRRRCGEVLWASLPRVAREAVSAGELVAIMLGCLRFAAYPDALQVLPKLRARGLKLAVISNWDISLSSVLSVTGLSPLLDEVLTSAEVGRAKPHPDIFMAGLARLQMRPGEALHVGDSAQADVAGAQAAGISAVLLCRQAHEPALTQSGVRVISSLAELAFLA
jgi:putative hydrolase of the HAD superfamily